jgi:hypothetical protein
MIDKETRFTRNGRFTRIDRKPGMNSFMIRPETEVFIELTDLEREGQVLCHDPNKGTCDLLYNPYKDRWEWAQMSTDYLYPYSPYAWAYKDITKEELLAKYPTAIEALKKPIPDDIGHWNYVAHEEIDAWA